MRMKDMTQGSIWKLILSFSVPLLLGNLLQQLYNAFDAIVVGNYVGKEALAAVGSTGPLINMIVAFFMGLSAGASVVISQSFGAKNDQALHETVHTAMTLALLMGFALTAIGVTVSPVLLRWMKTPAEILGDAIIYLRIYFAGMAFLTVYNMGAAILRAMGDARRPLYFLVITTILNVTLNLFFVLFLGMGIAGVAWSTVVAEAVSAVLVVIILTRAEGSYRLTLRKLRVYASVSGEIVRLGLPGGIQQSVISASNIVVQSYINGLGGAVMAGYSASTKLDQFITLPAQTMAMSVTTFVGQNLGAGKVDRARRGTRQSIIMGLCVSVCLSAIVMAARTSLLRIFTPDPEVLEHGFAFIRVFAPMYFLLCFTQIIPGALRGAGNVRMATATTIFSFVILRQIYLFVITRINYTITTVALAYPVTWAIAAVILTVYYSRSDWNRFSLQYGGKPLDSKD